MALKKTIVEMEPLLFMLDDDNYEKIVGIIEGGEVKAETSVVSALRTERKSESFVNKSTF
jgi:hypothetical protein